ncbi:hypothetical protein N9850_06005 [Granulosicoccus sp.]|nr:hypothetical protein [Granulosicoccus sp.]MDB4223306.1 hypothetical protein [Granulosicoccus sp.]
MIKKIAFVVALALSGCDSTSPPATGPATAPVGGMVNDAVTTIRGSAEFVNGVSAADTIEIELQGTQYSTEFNSDGTFELVIPKSESDETLVIEFHGDTIMHDAIKFPVAANASTTAVYATLSGRNPAITFEAEAGGTFENSNSYNRTKVTVPAQAFELSDGSIATGTIQVQITEADINNLSASGSWANNLYGVTEGSPVIDPLVTYGMAEFYFSQDGNELQLRDGFTATLEMDLLSPRMMGEDGFYKDAEVGDSIPLWYYDHEEVVWVNEGALAYLQEDDESPTGFVLAGQVTHFSHYNTDRPCPPVIPEIPPVDDPVLICPDDHPTLTCYWDFTYAVDVIISVTLVDDSSNARDSYRADSWTATLNGATHYMTNSDNERRIASGVYTMDWLGGVTGNESGSVAITVDDFTSTRYPGRIIKFAQVAGFNEFSSEEGENTVTVPWSWNASGDIIVDISINLPPL